MQSVYATAPIKIHRNFTEHCLTGGLGSDNRVVYFIHNPENGLTKIGYSKQVKRRAIQLRAERQAGVTVVLGGIYTGEYKALEQSLHYDFRAKRVKGEWFSLLANDVCGAIDSYRDKSCFAVGSFSPYLEQLPFVAAWNCSDVFLPFKFWRGRSEQKDLIFTRSDYDLPILTIAGVHMVSAEHYLKAKRGTSMQASLSAALSVITDAVFSETLKATP